MIKTSKLLAPLGAAASALLFSSAIYATSHDPAAIQASALKDSLAYEITEGLTTEVGPRQAGTEAEARARDWSVKKLKSLGFQNVRNEPFMMPTWVRGEETAEVTSPFPQKFHVTALGNSASTGAKGIEAEVVHFASLAAMKAVPDGSLAGKIAFVTHNMHRAQDGSGYGAFGPIRWVGPAIASQKGALAYVIKSIGTDYHRNPHAGNTNFPDGVKPIATGALSLPDADNLERMVKLARNTNTPVKMKLVLTPQNIGNQESGNIIAEVTGRDPSKGMILVACHLDSWDLATGAFDDAAGCGIVTAAAKQIMDHGKPLRTIRILWAGAEEVGLWGGKAYAKAHAGDKHAIAMESDFGADNIWRVEFNLPDEAKAVREQIAQALLPLGIGASGPPATGGADVRDIIASNNLAVIDLQQDGTRYFDLHHTPDDTLDKIDPKQMRQNVAAWSTVLSIIANSTADFTKPEKE
ncbi:M28 family peptidase [Parasphingorhabdus sp. JC815]|uniref:M28 family peptidase n=1 Tax=Parasphingorhabdus sp. JC815 TaxID=3232140 RepID=UPI0034594AD6